MRLRYLAYMAGLGLLAGLLWSQPSVAPTIPDQLKLRFFEDQAALQQAQATFQSTIADLNKVCGPDFTPSLVKGKLSCVVKPAAPTVKPGEKK